MAKGFGIAALVFALIAIFIPFGIFVSAIAIILAVISALAGDRVFATATAVVAFVNTLFLSPSTWILLGGDDPDAKRYMTIIIIIGVALPFVAMALNATGKLSLQKREGKGRAMTATMPPIRTNADPTPVLPALGKYYGFTSDLAYLIVRVTAGLMLIPHGWPKVMAGAAAVAANTLSRRGIEPALPLAYLIMFLETIGGIMIAIGLFTRPVALLLVIQFLVIIFVAHLPAGYGVGAGGIEFPLMWGLILLAILLRGGGPWSLDRKLGFEV